MTTLVEQLERLTKQQTPISPALEPLLPENATSEEKQAIANWLALLDLNSPTDPFAIAFVAMAGQQLRLEKAPGAIEAALGGIFKELDARMGSIETATAKQVEQRELQIRDKMADRLNPPLSLKALGVRAVTLALAATAGWFGARTIAANQPLDPRGPVQLTQTQADALAWAESSEGRFAHRMMDLNPELPSGACEREVRNSGIGFQVGSQLAESGFCVVWIKPPSQRRYRDAQ